MTTARHLLVDPDTPGYYHCISRCVRRAWLCGVDPYDGKSYEHRRAWVELRLLELAPEARKLLEAKRIDMGHARALLTLPTLLQVRLAHQAAEQGWSVRELEAEARKAQTQPKPKAAPRRDANVQSLETELSERLAARVAIQQGPRGRGKLVISYNSLDELDGILAKIR